MDISEYIGKWVTCDYKPASLFAFNVDSKNLSILSSPNLKNKGVCFIKINSVEETKEKSLLKINYDYLIIYDKQSFREHHYIVNKNHFSYFPRKAKFKETSSRSLNSNIRNMFKRVFEGIEVYLGEKI